MQVLEGCGKTLALTPREMGVTEVISRGGIRSDLGVLDAPLAAAGETREVWAGARGPRVGEISEQTQGDASGIRRWEESQKEPLEAAGAQPCWV